MMLCYSTEESAFWKTLGDSSKTQIWLHNLDLDSQKEFENINPHKALHGHVYSSFMHKTCQGLEATGMTVSQ